ncbi:hypothetical protein ACFY2R_23880 [Micromonospora olivasterospora]|uniref:Uncharacterized protein n=1 Tax=Micromonospora olivasterospora TaxID=1880 RepID=A0A562IJK4_MICOL|nr:hypothetical protein [Micromonospora olivasterospora]TWH70873.1 hypothetical protein JD77_05898 [Micromonospora olivasterospora]
MRPFKLRPPRLVAAVLAVSLVLAGCTDDSSEPAKVSELAGAMSTVAQDLPPDAVEAAERLVDIVLDGTPDQSVAAAAELLRRSGVPIVSSGGPVVAMPDALVLYDSPVYAELIPALVTATRARDRYAVDQWATLLTSLGLTTRKLTFAQVTNALAGWGKLDGEQPAFTTAAAVVRALSARRGQVLYPAAAVATTYLDPLQTVLLLAHATSRFGMVRKSTTKATALGLAAGAFVVARADDDKGPCEVFTTLFETDNVATKANSDFLKDQLKDRLAGAVLKEGAKEIFDRASEAYGKAGATLSVIMLMLGARLTLTSDKTSTHFKHQAGSRAEHVTLTAKAEFDIKIAADKLECYSLAGLSIPKAGPLEGFTIKWSSEQDQRGTIQKGGSAYLVAVSADSTKMTKGGKTGADGVSTLEVKPPVEKPAGTGEKLKGSATFIAKMDKENFPFELGDLFALGSGAAGFAVSKIFDLVKDALTRAGLPEQSITVGVDYHGSDIIVAKGHGRIELILAAIPDAYVDLVSCSGIQGPFKGTGGFGGSVTEWIRLARLIGVPVADEYPGGRARVSVMGNAGQPNPFPIMKGEGGKQFLDGVLTFYPPASANSAVILDDKRVGRPVGEVEMLVAGNPFPFGDLVWPAVRVTSDPRCPEVTYEYDNA